MGYKINPGVKKDTIVIVHALDWVITTDGQMDEAEAESLRPVETWIVGYVVNVGEDFLTVASHYFESEVRTWRHAISIPMGSLCSVTPVGEAWFETDEEPA